ncbi:MAG: glycogen debranching enzyme family protein [Lachnospiraceae bacterium]|nr:glycogen debranching enzyme family protein [Lachnospiraceae bacterium]
MRFVYTQENWKSIEEGEKNCFLLTNALGGYVSLTLIGSVARGDQALFMAAKKAPNVRWHMVTNLLEEIFIDGRRHVLTSQRMQDAPDYEGFRYLKEFVFDDYPEWIFEVEGLRIHKTMYMVHGENIVGMRYWLEDAKGHTVDLKLTPWLRFTAKNTPFSESQKFTMRENLIQCEDAQLCVATNAMIQKEEDDITESLYFSQDERDGRDSKGKAHTNHYYIYELSEESEDCYLLFSTNEYEYYDGMYDDFLEMEKEYRAGLLDMAFAKSELGQQLTMSADSYIVNRDSTMGKSIIAGYPFFEDWGRDTMIALSGVTMVTGRFEECKSILRTFAKYMKDGLLPNLFPEGDEEPMYNSIDAPLLFVNAVYEYMEFSNDEEFLYEIWQYLIQVMDSYMKGTNYGIRMDEDYLIKGGSGLQQLTWMDVRVGDYLPTPRHGKPVEINAYWYNALCVMGYMAEKLACSGYIEQEDAMTLYQLQGEYSALAAKVKNSFMMHYWNEEEQCLKDVLSGKRDENQVRCNQVWALSMPFTMTTEEMERKVLEKITKELYTPIGLRTLSPKDREFHGIYIGPMEERDRAYHQGTTWAFPLGAFYRACIRYMIQYPDKVNATQITKLGMAIEGIKEWLYEGCVGQIAEIYDGEEPTVSRGCFAQAWSVGELLRAVYDWERFQERLAG